MSDSKIETQEQAHKLLGQRLEAPQKTNDDNVCIKTLRSCCIIPQRLIMGILCFLGVFNAYTMRICLGLAITQMVNHTKTFISHIEDPDACSGENVTLTNDTVPSLNPHAIFDWNEATQGFILSGFFYGYIWTQVLGGSVAERIGAKWVLGFGIFSTAVLTVLTPAVTRWGGSNWLFLLRFLEGIGEGPVIPALMVVMSRWVPPNERSLQGALVYGGAHLGNLVGSTMSGVLLADGKDWAMVFYFFGGLAFIWFILWTLAAYSTPNSHPYISEKELELLELKVTINPKTVECKDPVPWNAIFRSKPMWAIVAAAVSHDWGLYMINIDLPKYFHDVLKFKIDKVGYLTSLLYAALVMSSFISGGICDYFIKKGYHSIKTGRIIHTTIATTGPAICILLASYAGCNGTLAVTYLIISLTLMGGFYSGAKVNTLDVAPNYSGTVTSIANSFSNISGIIVPYLIGQLTPDSTLAQWRIAFWVTFVVMVVTNVIYIAWAEGEQQWWDDVRQHGYPDGWLAKHRPLLKEDILPKEESLKEQIE